MMRLLVVGIGVFAIPLPAQVVSTPAAIHYTLIIERVADTAVVIPALKRWGVVVESHYKTVLNLGSASPYYMKGKPTPFLILDSLRAIRRSDGTSPILYAEYNRSVRADEASVSFIGNWGLDSLRVYRARAMGDSGQGVLVGVMDSGVMDQHPEFAGRFAGGASFTNEFGIDSSAGSWRDPNGACRYHGTHVSGTAVGRTVGVAPGARLLFARVFDTYSGTDCVSWVGNQIAAFYWLSDHGAQVINSSISGSFYGAYEAALWLHPETIMVGAAGNNGSYVNFPGSSQYGIAAAALNANLSHASYSNVGPGQGFSTPGTGIYSAYGPTGYSTKSGTSMAAPHLTGLIALWLSARPGTARDSIVSNLAAVSLDLGTPGYDETYGWGMPRADRVVARAMGIPEQPTSTATVRLAAGGTVQTGCVGVTGPVEWRPASAATWLTVSAQGDSLCYATSGTVPPAAVDTVHLQVVP